MKACLVCGVEKPLAAFHRDPHIKRDGYKGTCKECVNTRSRVAHRRKRGIPTDRRCIECAADINARHGLARFCEECYAARRRFHHQLAQYGLTAEEFADLLATQGGHCAMCDATDGLQVDHDHDSGAVRGLLCSPCNRILGLVKDDPEILRAGIAYLQRDTSLLIPHVEAGA